MDREIELVRNFHEKFGQLDNSKPVHLTKRKLAERFNFMLEELFEGAQAAGLALKLDPLKFVPEMDDQDAEGIADALVDLDYVLKGTAAMLGLAACWTELFDDVHAANMRKELRPTKRAMGGADVGKPIGWAGPETGKILHRAGYRRRDFVKLDGNDDHAIYVVDDALCVDDPWAKS
jgi:predicted HAD superfamily Cof-like phosphohydrolase